MSEARVEALVLRLAQFGEADRMASLLCADGSRREVRVGQARRSRKRFGGFDLYVRGDFHFGPDRRGRPRLESVSVTEGYDGLRGDLVRSALAGHVAELVAQASQEGHPLPDLFALVTSALTGLAAGVADAAPRGWARGFELKLLHVLGLRPALLHDASSRAPLGEGPVRWSTTHGGAIGPDGPTDARSLAIELGTLRLMNAALRTPLADQADVAWTPAAADEAERALHAFLSVHVGRRSRARAFLAEVLAVPLLALAVLATGCGGYTAPTSVRVQGWLYESAVPSADTPTVTGSEAVALDDSGAFVAEATEPFSDAPGYVRFAGLPPDTRHHHVFLPPAGEDHPEVTEHVATVVVGESASDDLFLDAGQFHLWTRAAVDGWLTAWELTDPLFDAPSLDPETDDGGFVRAFVVDPEVHLGARFALTTSSGQQLRAVYLDADGAPSPEEGLTASGGFFVFGADPGPAQLRRVLDDDTLGADSLPVWIEEDAVTSLPQVFVGG